MDFGLFFLFNFAWRIVILVHKGLLQIGKIMFFNIIYTFFKWIIVWLVITELDYVKRDNFYLFSCLMKNCMKYMVERKIISSMSFQPHHLNFFLFFVFFVDNIIRRNEEEIKIYISSNQLLNLYVTVLLQKNIVLFAIFQSFWHDCDCNYCLYHWLEE